MVQQSSNQKCEGRQDGAKPLTNTLRSLILGTFQLSSKTVAKKALYNFKAITTQGGRNSQFHFQNI